MEFSFSVITTHSTAIRRDCIVELLYSKTIPIVTIGWLFVANAPVIMHLVPQLPVAVWGSVTLQTDIIISSPEHGDRKRQPSKLKFLLMTSWSCCCLLY
jgi:hypothetical protein